MCFGCSKEPSHRDGSFEYPQHRFWLRNKKNNFQLRTLIWGPGTSWCPIYFSNHIAKEEIAGSFNLIAMWLYVFLCLDWSAVFEFAFPGHTQMMFHVIHVDLFFFYNVLV